MKQLAYGLSSSVPKTATAAWGARLIVTANGYVDFVPDRIDAVGNPEARADLFDKLSTTIPTATLTKIISSKLLSRELDTREAREVVLFDDDGVKVVADTLASAGYLYIAAWATA